MRAPASSSRLTILGGRVVTPLTTLDTGAVVIDAGKITAVTEAPPPAPDLGEVIDARGLTVAPGLIDIHIHGAMGYDTMDATPEAIAGMARFVAEHGVTSFLPTTVTANRADTLAAIENVAACMGQQTGGAQVLGIYLEGPYVNARQKGAQAPDHIRVADPDEYEAFFQAGPVRLVTLAPEIPENRALIPYAVERGAAVAVGHSVANYDEVLRAVSLGMNQATHTFNGMTGIHHREPGTAGASLSCDAIYAQVIVDFVHIHPAVVKVLVRAKGLDRAVLITDAMRATGMPDGVYDLGGQNVTVVDGAARLASGSLAGSTLTLDRAVRNVMQAAGLSLDEALRMATLTAAQSIGVADHKGSLEPGKDADVVLLDAEHRVVMTIVGGQVVYRANGAG